MLELRRRGATLLEEGTLKGPIARLLGRAWARRSQKVARPLDVPAGIATIGVGGATLGGSYRTPTAIAIAPGYDAPPYAPNWGYLANAALSLLPAVDGAPLTLQRMLGWLFAPLACVTANGPAFPSPSAKRRVDVSLAWTQAAGRPAAAGPYTRGGEH